jgi:hypothetical protein
MDHLVTSSGRFDQHVRSVSHDSLRAVGGDHMAEIDMLSRV